MADVFVDDREDLDVKAVPIEQHQGVVPSMERHNRGGGALSASSAPFSGRRLKHVERLELGEGNRVAG